MINKKFILGLWISSLLAVVLSILFYIIEFSGNKISNDPERWAQFGDYLGGVLGTIISLLNLLIFIYLSIKLISIEEERNKWTLKELVRPYADIILDKNKWNISISISNIGLGPMIIKEIKILDNNNNICGTFEDILKPNSGKVTQEFLSFTISDDHCAIGKDKDLEILNIKGDNNDINYQNLIYNYLLKLKELRIEFTYYDMYGKEIDTVSTLMNYKTVFNRIQQ